MFSLQNKKAVITGGGSGIGQVIATIIAKQGAEVHVLELNADQAQSTLEEIESNGNKCFIYTCDVSDQ